MSPSWFSKFLERLTTKPGASRIAIELAERTLNLRFPEEYSSFLTETNGAEGFIGPNSYLILWEVENLASRNAGYNVNEFAPGLLLFASDGSGNAYAFDSRYENMPIVKVPFVGMSITEIESCGGNFPEFLENLSQA